jgi:hypothetical protein
VANDGSGNLVPRPMLTVEVCFWDLADLDADDEHVCF